MSNRLHNSSSSPWSQVKLSGKDPKSNSSMLSSRQILAWGSSLPNIAVSGIAVEVLETSSTSNSTIQAKPSSVNVTWWNFDANKPAIPISKPPPETSRSYPYSSPSRRSRRRRRRAECPWPSPKTSLYSKRSPLRSEVLSPLKPVKQWREHPAGKTPSWWSPRGRPRWGCRPERWGRTWSRRQLWAMGGCLQWRSRDTHSSRWEREHVYALGFFEKVLFLEIHIFSSWVLGIGSN